MDCLLRLVDDIAVLTASWEREPVLSTGLGEFGDVLSLAEIDAALARGYPVDSVRLVENGRPVPTGSVAAAGRYGRSAAERVTDGAKVARRVAAGATLILENLKAHFPAVAAFAAEVSEATGYDTYCTAFLTPAGHPGVAPHHDTASVFVRQLSGAKHWRVSRPVEPWPLREHRGRRTAGTETVLETTLTVGDCLYVPRGFVHAAAAGTEPSLHLSVALRPVPWGLLLRQALERAMDERAELREALPPAFSDADRAALLRERAGVLVAYLDALTDSGTADELVRATVPGAQAPGALLSALRGGGRG